MSNRIASWTMPYKYCKRRGDAEKKKEKKKSRGRETPKPPLICQKERRKKEENKRASRNIKSGNAGA